MNEATQTGAESIEARIAAALEEPQDAPAEEETSQEPEQSEPEQVEEAEAESEEQTSEEEPEGESETEEDAAEEYELDAEGLAEILGTEGDNVLIDEDGAISFKTKVDGETSTAKLADLVKSYQLEGHLNKKSMALADERKAFEAEVQTQQNALAERLAVVDQYTQRAEETLMREYKGVDWERLKTEDPGRYAQLQTDYGMAYNELQQIKGNASQVVEQARQEALKGEQAQRAKLYQEQNELLLAQNPGWADPQVRAADVARITEYAVSVGFTPDEIENVLDARVVRLLQDAAKASQVKTKADVVKKKVKRAPKIMKPGAKVSKSASAQQQAQKKLAKLKQSGDVHDLANILMDRI